MERIAAARHGPAQDGRNSVNSFADAFADEAPQASFGQLFGQPASNAKGKTARPPVAAESPEKDAPGASFLLQSRQTQANVLADMKRTGAQNATFNGQPLDSSSTSVAAAPAFNPGRGSAPASAYVRDSNYEDPNSRGYQMAHGTGSADPVRLAAHVATGLGSSIYGGIKGVGVGLSTLMQGGSKDEAINAAGNSVTDAQKRYTYNPDPKTETGKMAAAFDSHGNPLNWPGVAGQYAGGKIADAGYPAAGAAVNAATSVLALPAIFKGAGALRGGAATEAEIAGRGAAPSPAAPASPAVPGNAPTLAQATPETQQAVSSAGARADPAAVARHVEAETLPVPGKLTAGQATQDPALISTEMNGRGKGQSAPVTPEFYQNQGKTVAANMDSIRASAAPDVPSSASVVDHGQALLDAYKTKDAATSADISAKYKALSDANGGSLPVNGTDFVASADAALSKQMKGRYVPKEVAADMEQFRQGGPMTFEDFENMRTNLAAEGRKADRAGDGNAAAAINIVRNSLESLPIMGETAAIKPLADAARSAAKARFDAIRADPAYKAAVNDPTELGQPSPAADRFFNSYVRDGARENVARMRANLQENPQAAQTIAAGTLDHLKGQMKADPVTGNFSSAAYSKALKTFGPKMESLVDPTTAQQLQAVGGFAKNAQTQPRGSYVNNSNTAVALAAQGAKSVLEHGTNVLFNGLPVGTVGRKVGAYVSDTVAARKATQESLAPGAGITRLSDLLKK